MNKREIHLDVIRIVACLAVILFHYNVYLLYADPKVARIGEISYLHQTVGDIAISLFIILSGFALTISQGKVTDNFREGANKRGNSSRLTQSFHFFMFEPFFLP
ncbi:acyltransferase family protein [Aeromonas caviae]|uniref:acyltransferase family protein n=1 Tax=Aeromonas caviae TaxID=648 RepID=UPI003AF8A992